MNMQENNPYDQIPYTSYPFAQTHPNRLATMAALHGIQPTPITNCRVLEVGCGDGANLIPMALGLPDSQFVGFDLAAKPVERGREIISDLGLTNIDLRQANLMEFDDEPFDYIITHGLYAWVPPVVQDGLMALCQRLLKPNGVAYISYNAYPGCHLREMTREMMLFHVRGNKDPRDSMNQGLSLLRFILDQYPSESAAREDLYGAIVTEQFEMLARHRHREQVYHDHLAENYRPAYFFQFIGHAAQHGLQYLSEASYSDMTDYKFPPSVRELLAQFDDEQAVQREQYLDFLKGRSFRQTLLCRDNLKVQRTIASEQVKSFYLSSEIEIMAEAPDLSSGVVEAFEGPKGARIQTDFPLAKAALVILKEQWPRSLTWDELQTAAIERVKQHQSDSFTAEHLQALAEIMLAAFGSGVIQLHSHRPEIQLAVTSHPVAYSLARWQAQHGTVVTNLMHASVILENEVSKQLVRLLDGTRDHAALIADLTVVMEPRLPLKINEETTIDDRVTL
ncbi:MAG TPA: methyltransferase regulatory domain-containing protein, partial [Blastocatellia bacterium]|nr:methyltransferase regulatory domain-containing protein [Blastocatellia bacterium]